MQLAIEVEPWLAVDCKPGQSIQRVWPLSDWYIPLAHGLQGSTPVDENVPGAHIPKSR